MKVPSAKYQLSGYAIFFAFAAALFISWMFKWHLPESPVNFIDGDARDYYSSLISVFIKHDLVNQQGNEWYILKTAAGTINVHPIGEALLLLPFFLLACLLASLGGFAVDGLSLPFQLGVAAAAIVYAMCGLLFLKRLLQLHHISDRVTAFTLLIVFFGTNLLYYTIAEPAMSHVYSFSLVAAFLYTSCRFVLQRRSGDALWSAALLGLILLVRPNNVFVLLSVLMWFRSGAEVRQFLKDLVRQPLLYKAVGLTAGIVSLQSLVWWLQSRQLFHYTYKADGFYWLQPQLLKMLFGFDSGFFIYTPLCLLFLFGLVVLYRENRFSFFVALGLLLLLFYFFSCYWAYTYFDGIGIRVLVDYYALLAFFGAKLFEALSSSRLLYLPLAVTVLCVGLNLVYNYQVDRGILYKAGMNYAKWKYVLLKIAPEYRFCLGGSQDFVPYSRQHPAVALSRSFDFQGAFDYSGKEFGVVLPFDSLGFASNRLHLKIDVARQEMATNASAGAMVCAAVEDRSTGTQKAYFQFKLNETPARDCCERREYAYTMNLGGNFNAADRLLVYIWNIDRQPFLIDKFNVRVYNYNYQLH